MVIKVGKFQVQLSDLILQ